MALIKVNNRGQSDNLGRRNLFINGAMQVAQRGSATINNAEAFGQVDRFKGYGITGGQFSLAQSTDSPVGFTNSLIATVTSADSSIASGDYYGITHRIEGTNTGRLNYGTSNAVTTTLSFYVKSSLTGLFGGAIRNSAVNRSFNFSYTINSANTWERKSYTIVGDQTGTWLTDNGIGLRVSFSLGDGSSRLEAAGTWRAGNYAGVTGQTNFISTGSATLQLTGVQLETGDTATDFEHLSFGEELSLCSRYYHTSFSGETTIGGSHPANYAGKVFSWCDHAGSSTDRVAFNYNWPVQMRDAPTVTMYGNQWTAARVSKYNGGNNEYTIDYASGVSKNGLGGYYDVAGTSGDFIVAYVEASAEL